MTSQANHQGELSIFSLNKGVSGLNMKRRKFSILFTGDITIICIKFIEEITPLFAEDKSIGYM